MRPRTYDEPELVLGCLAIPLYGYPFEAMSRALEIPDEVTPHLLAALAEAADVGWEQLNREQRSLLVYGLFLLAAFRERAAFTDLWRLYEKSHAALDVELVGALPRLFVATFDGRLSRLFSLIEKEAAPSRVRMMALTTLSRLQGAGRLGLKSFLAYLGHLLVSLEPRQDPELWACLDGICERLLCVKPGAMPQPAAFDALLLQLEHLQHGTSAATTTTNGLEAGEAIDAIGETMHRFLVQRERPELVPVHPR